MEIYDFAKQMEADGEQFYRKLAANTSHKGIGEILIFLAEDEKKHAETIEKIKKDAFKMKETEILDNAKAVFNQMKEHDVYLEVGTDEIAILRQAREIEQKSISFYLDRADQIEEPEKKEMFERLAEEERKHYRLIDSMEDFYFSPQTWLQNAEFAHLEEY